MKLYLYGYLNQARSSRRLAREAERNLEVIWLMKGLRPGYRTLAEFRAANAKALSVANRDFVVLMRELELLGGELVAIDGAFFHGNASKACKTAGITPYVPEPERAGKAGPTAASLSRTSATRRTRTSIAVPHTGS